MDSFERRRFFANSSLFKNRFSATSYIALLLLYHPDRLVLHKSKELPVHRSANIKHDTPTTLVTIIPTPTGILKIDTYNVINAFTS